MSNDKKLDGIETISSITDEFEITEEQFQGLDSGTERVEKELEEDNVKEMGLVVDEEDPAENKAFDEVRQEDESFMFINDIVEYSKESGTVELEDPVLIPRNKDSTSFMETLPLPPTPQSIMFRYSENFPNLEIENSSSGREWLSNFENSVPVTYVGDQFVRRLKKEGSEFKQHVEFENNKLRPGVLKLGSNLGDNLTGERAVYWVKAATGQGGIIQIPLWNSGFWVSLKTPSESALLSLNARIAEDKVTFGRQTYGLAFANSSVYFTNNLLEFVYDHIFDHTLKDVRDIRPYISAHDINQLVWGIACTIWRNGFHYSRSVINPDNSVGEKYDGLLAVPKMCVVDNSALTDWQKSHMAGRHGKNMTLESIERYRKEFTVGHSRYITIDEEHDIQIELSVPNVDKYITSGQKWVDYIIAKVEDSMERSTSENKRNEYIVNYGKASLLRQYAHWVKSIKVQDRSFTDTETIEALLDDFSSNDTIREIYFKEIGKFIDDTTVSLIAVPAISGVDDLRKESRFPYLVPIDPLMTFFILLVQKAEIITAR